MPPKGNTKARAEVVGVEHVEMSLGTHVLDISAIESTVLGAMETRFAERNALVTLSATTSTSNWEPLALRLQDNITSPELKQHKRGEEHQAAMRALTAQLAAQSGSLSKFGQLGGRQVMASSGSACGPAMRRLRASSAPPTGGSSSEDLVLLRLPVLATSHVAETWRESLR